MANRVKEVSAFDGTSWGAAVPLGVDDSNVDITSSTTQPDGSAVSGVSGDSATALDTSAVAVSEGDTGASAWTKFNRFRKRVASNFANYMQGSIATSYNATGSDSAVYSTNVLNNYMANVIGYSGTTAPTDGTVAAQLSSLNDNKMDKDDFLLKFTYGDHSNGQAYPLAQLRISGATATQKISFVRYSNVDTIDYYSSLIGEDGTFLPDLFKYREYTSDSTTTTSQGRGVVTVTATPPSHYIFFGVRNIYFYSSGNYSSTYSHFSIQSWHISGNNITIRAEHDQGASNVAFRVVVSIIFLHSKLASI